MFVNFSLSLGQAQKKPKLKAVMTFRLSGNVSFKPHNSKIQILVDSV